MSSWGNSDWTIYDQVYDDAAMDYELNGPDPADYEDPMDELTPEERATVRPPRRAWSPPRRRPRVPVDPDDFL